MSILTILLALAREMFPFLKEALLEGLTFRAWLKSNWQTFAGLVTMLSLTLMIAHLVDTVQLVARNEKRAYQAFQNIQPPLQDLLKKYRRIEGDNMILTEKNFTLNSERTALINKLARYKTRVHQCSVRLNSHGQCRAAVVGKPTLKIRPASPLNPEASPEDQEKKRNFLQRIGDVLHGRRKKSP